MSFLNDRKHLVAKCLLFFYSMIMIGSWLVLNIGEAIHFALLFLFLSVPAWMLNSYIVDHLCDVTVSCDKHINEKLVFVLSFLFSAFILGIWLYAFYPGGYAPDSIVQYTEALTGSYSNWHPVWHTLLFFTLPLKIFKSTVSIVILQILYFSLMIGFLGVTLSRLGGIKLSIIGVLYILLNPYTGEIGVYPLKDVAFAIAGGVLFLCVVNIYISKGGWLSSWWKYLLIIVSFVNATLFRHNAILFTAPLLLSLFFLLSKKKVFAISAVSAVLYFLITGPLYSSLHVSKPGARVIETTGFPHTMIFNVAKVCPEKMDEELSEYVYSMASPERCQEYILGSFNSIKWGEFNGTPIEQAGYAGVLKMTWKSIQASPVQAFKAAIAVSNTVYGIETGKPGAWGPAIDSNDWGIEQIKNDTLASFLDNYRLVINSTSLSYFRIHGFALFLIVAAICVKLSRDNRHKILICLCILFYDFGTMLLLSGNDIRFFYITYVVCPVILGLLFWNSRPLKA